MESDRVTSADADTWRDVAQAIRNRLVGLTLQPDLTAEQMYYIVGAARGALELELRAAHYDDLTGEAVDG